MEFKDSVAIITGGASGLGEATTRKFHSLGSKVCLFDLDDLRGEKLERELGENCAYFSVDVCHEANIKEALSAVIKQFNKININAKNRLTIGPEIAIFKLPFEVLHSFSRFAIPPRKKSVMSLTFRPSPIATKE